MILLTATLIPPNASDGFLDLVEQVSPGPYCELFSRRARLGWAAGAATSTTRPSSAPCSHGSSTSATTRLPLIVHGDSRGADRLAARVARELGMDTESHPADWRRWGKSAGWVRNSQMAQAGAVLCVAFPGGRGTASMVSIAREARIPVFGGAPRAREAMGATVEAED